MRKESAGRHNHNRMTTLAVDAAKDPMSTGNPSIVLFIDLISFRRHARSTANRLRLASEQ